MGRSKEVDLWLRRRSVVSAPDGTAGDAVARIPRRIAAVIILGGMDDDRRAIAVEQRPGTGAEREVLEQVLDGKLSRLRNIYVGQIARVGSLAVEESVLTTARQVIAGRFELRPLTASDLMNVQRVNARGHVSQIELQENSVWRLLEPGLANLPSLRIDQGRGRGGHR